MVASAKLQGHILAQSRVHFRPCSITTTAMQCSTMVNVATHSMPCSVAGTADAEHGSMTFKLLIAFERMSLPNLAGKAHGINTSLLSEPALTLLPDPWPARYPSRADLSAAVTAFAAAHVAAADGSRPARSDRDQKRDVMIQMLKAAAPYFESVAKAANDLTILYATGYDLRRPNDPIPQPLPAPVLKVFRNGLSGVLIGRANAIRGASSYEAQICHGTTTEESNWRTAVISRGCSRLQFTKLAPGQVYSFRLRALGRKGWGPWSDIAQLMAT
jgi:hypothetical protein